MDKRFLGCTFTLVLLLFPLRTLAQAGPNHSSAAATQKEFQTLINRYYETWNSGDPEKAALLYAKDPDLVFYDLTPLKYTGWAEYDKGVRTVLGSFAEAKLAPHDDLRVTRHGTIAWTTETWHLSGKKKAGETVEIDGRHTTIWELRGGHWVIVHEHFSAPLS